MAKCSQPINKGSILPGMIASAIILCITLAAFIAICSFISKEQVFTILNNVYLWNIILFTFKQALISTFLSIIPAIFIAVALFRQPIIGKSWLLRLYSLTFVLPTLVVIIGITGIYGRSGWLAQLTTLLNLPYSFPLYGLSGILLAHIFYNLPLAIRFFLQALEAIPTEQQQLSAQLGLSYLQHFRFIEWPAIKKQLIPTAALIFMLCFSSFAIVLTLGGSPKNTTIEVAIFQAIRNFDLSSAAILALIQIIICLSMTWFSHSLVNPGSENSTYKTKWKKNRHTLSIVCWDSFWIALSVLLLLPPLLIVLIKAVINSSSVLLFDDDLANAVITSLRIALSSGFLAITLTFLLLWSSRQYYLVSCFRWAKRLELSGIVILAMPSMVLATGFFLLLNATIGIPDSISWLIIISNALIAIPFTLKILTPPMYNSAICFDKLCRSLGIQGLTRFYWIDLKSMRKPLALAFSLACLISIGDFGIVALFGGEDVVTLPYYLYEQIGSYRQNDAMVTAGILLLLALLLFTAIEYFVEQNHDKT